MGARVVLISDSPINPFTQLTRLIQIWGQTPSTAPKVALVLVMSVCFGIEPAFAAKCGTGSGVAAVDTCKTELSKYPDNTELKLRYADVLMSQKLYQQAVDILGDVLEKQPGNTTARKKYRLASSLAEGQSIKALSTNTAAAGTRNSVKEILCKSLKGQKAIKACDEVLASDPNNVTALTRRGDELMKLEQINEAVASYQQAVKIDPSSPTLKEKLELAQSRVPQKTTVAAAKVPSKKELAEAASRKKLKVEAARLAENKRLAKLEKKQKEAELEAELQESVPEPEVVATYSNAALVNGSTY